MVADVINMAWYQAMHQKTAKPFPVVVFNAYAEFWLTVNRAWFDAVFHPYR